MEIDIGNIEWDLLRKQKAALIKQIGILDKLVVKDTACELTGILHLVDHIQDEVAYLVGDATIFGNESNEVEADK
jgi:hypothetical protein